MISDKIDKMIAEAMKNREKGNLETLKLIKCEFVKAVKDGVALDDASEAKILMKMASQREDSIRQYVEGGRDDLANAEQEELAVIKRFLPKQATDKEVEEFTTAKIAFYMLAKEGGYKLSMKDMKPILAMVHEKYPTANGKLVSKVLNSVLAGKK